MNLEQFRDHIVIPTLRHINADSPAARRLVIGTALAESGLEYVVQIGGGPAVGFYQMEPATYMDIWKNFLPARPLLKAKLEEMLPSHMEPAKAWEAMTYNMAFSTAMCRAHYLRVSEALPQADDLDGLAAYWKKHYNTHLGKGKTQDFAAKARKVMGL